MNPYDNLPDPLPFEEEMELLHGDLTVLHTRDKLVLHSLKHAMKYACAVCRGALPADEIMSLCGVALMKAVGNYDPTKGCLTLLSFSKPYIRGQIQKTWRALNPVTYGPEIPDRTQDENIDHMEEVVDPDFDTIHFHERWEWVVPHLSRLSETERRVIVLHFNGRMSFVEIGELLGCTRENVRITKERALKKIRKALMREKKFLNT